MSCKLNSEKETNIVPMKDLPGGKIGVIVLDNCNFDGWIVQRCNNKSNGFIILGRKSRSSTQESNGFNETCELPVRILDEGELIEVHYS